MWLTWHNYSRWQPTAAEVQRELTAKHVSVQLASKQQSAGSQRTVESKLSYQRSETIACETLVTLTVRGDHLRTPISNLPADLLVRISTFIV